MNKDGWVRFINKVTSLPPPPPWALSCSNDKTLRLWDLQSHTCLAVLEGHTESVYGVCADFGAGRALSCSRDKTLRLWDLQSHTCLAVLVGHKSCVRGVCADFGAGR